MNRAYIKKIKELLSATKKIDYAFVFGSALRTPLPGSDVDILIGANLTSSERIDLAMKLELILKRKIDLVLAKEASCELVSKAFSKGMPVLINNKQSLKRDYLKNFYLYEEGTNLRQLRTSRIKRRYSYGG